MFLTQCLKLRRSRVQARTRTQALALAQVLARDLAGWALWGMRVTEVPWYAHFDLEKLLWPLWQLVDAF